jgi:hypothetical protein
MATALEVLRASLASQETLRKCLEELEGYASELLALKAARDAERDGLAEDKRIRSQIAEDIVKTNVELRGAQELLAAQTEKNGEELGKQQAQLRAVERKLKDAQAQYENVISGLKALKERI